MKLKDNALPIHKDARIKVRPRHLLRGQPVLRRAARARPSAADLDDGDTIPASQTSAPVQLDQVLGTLKTDTRKDLQKLLVGYGDALNGKPQPGEDADQDPATKGETGRQVAERLAPVLRASALRGGAIVNEALLGTDLHDLSKLIGEPAEGLRGAVIARGLAQGPHHQLQHHDGRARVARRRTCAQTIHELPRVLEAAQPGARQPERGVPAHARLGARDDPGRPRDAGHDRGGLPVDPPDARAAVARRAAGPRRRPPAGCRRLRRVHGRPGGLPAGARRVQPLPAQRDPADAGAADRRRRALHRPAELRGVLPVDGRARRRVRQNFDGNGTYTRFQAGRRLRGPDAAGRAGSGALHASAAAPPLGTPPGARAPKPPYKPERQVLQAAGAEPERRARSGAGP